MNYTNQTIPPAYAGSTYVTFEKYQDKGEAMNTEKLSGDVKDLMEEVEYLRRAMHELEDDLRTVVKILQRAEIIEHSYDSVAFRSMFGSESYKINKQPRTDA